MPKCPECNGQGRILPVVQSHDGSTFDLQNEPCLRCEGTGEVLADVEIGDLNNERAPASDD